MVCKLSTATSNTSLKQRHLNDNRLQQALSQSFLRLATILER